MNRTAHRIRLALAIAGTFTLAACSTGMSNAPVISQSTAPHGEATPASSERPGLGTAWGETRYAPVHDVAFERGSDQPFSVVAVHYDDRAGAAAMAERVVQSGDVHSGDIPVRSGLRVSILDEEGLPLPAYAAAGTVFVIGESGRRYRLLVNNGTPHRLEVVLSVDGLDVIDGSPAQAARRGYVVDPFSTLTVDGFRRSDREVAAFRFSSVRGSYAAQTAGDANVGVIGWAFYAERGARAWDVDPTGDVERRLDAQPFSDSRYAQPPPGAR